MKFIQYILIGLVLLLSIELSVQNSSKIKEKRKQSMMDYLNNFFSEDANIDSKLDIADETDFNKNRNHIGSRKYRFKETQSKERYEVQPKPAKEIQQENQIKPENHTISESDKNSTADNNVNSTKPIINDRPLTPEMILGEYFMISSSALRDTSKFPPIVLEDGSTIRIPIDNKDFRINTAFNEQDNIDKLPSNEFFWFRLSGLNLYYSMTKTDINILGAVSIQSIVSVLSTGTEASNNYITTCFSVIDTSKSSWKICGLKEVTVKYWYCQIKAFLKDSDDILCQDEKNENNHKNIKKDMNFTQPIIIIPLPSRKCNQMWNYNNEGDDWECDCSEGREQAPIDLPSKVEAIETSVRPMFQYERIEPGSLKSTIDGFYKEGKSYLNFEYRENLLRTLHPRFGKIVTLDGAVYYAEEIVFHTPSEHTFEGKKFDMEVQIIHFGQTKGDIAKQIVLSFLFEKSPGAINSFIEDFNYFDLPNFNDPHKEILQPIFIPKILQTNYDNENQNEKSKNKKKDDEMISMNPFSFFTYQGSITFPPCTENTIMYVASEPLKIGSTALQLFEEAIRIPDFMDQKGNVISSDSTGKSSRNTQPLNGRPVFHYDQTKYCPPSPKKKNKQVGHYEKINKAITNYFYVNDDNTSGLPNALVVSEDEAFGKELLPKHKE